jgi:hypothetical protein
MSNRVFCPAVSSISFPYFSMFLILHLAIYLQIQSGYKEMLYKRCMKHEKLRPALEIDQKTRGRKKVTENGRKEKVFSLKKKTVFFFLKKVKEESQLFISGS